MFSRELQALDELLSREPEDWAEWAGFARDHFAAKREPSPGGVFSKAKPTPPPVKTDLGNPKLPKFKPTLSPIQESPTKIQRELLD